MQNPNYREQSISVIIPVFNEVRTLSSIVEIVLAWGRATEVIIINDGSTDQTIESVQQFSQKISIISFTHNHGKAYAMAKGIHVAKGDYLLFLDGDIVGLTCRDLDALIRPAIRGKAKMTIGARYTHTFTLPRVFKPIGGERCIRRDDLVPIVDKIKHLGYGVELFLNDHFGNKHIAYVDMPYVSILGKFEKHTIPDSVASYLKEAVDLVTEIARQQAGEVTPNVSRLYRMTQRYIKHALDYFQ